MLIIQVDSTSRAFKDLYVLICSFSSSDKGNIRHIARKMRKIERKIFRTFTSQCMSFNATNFFVKKFRRMSGIQTISVVLAKYSNLSIHRNVWFAIRERVQTPLPAPTFCGLKKFKFYVDRKIAYWYLPRVIKQRWCIQSIVCHSFWRIIRKIYHAFFARWTGLIVESIKINVSMGSYTIYRSVLFDKDPTICNSRASTTRPLRDLCWCIYIRNPI